MAGALSAPCHRGEEIGGDREEPYVTCDPIVVDGGPGGFKPAEESLRKLDATQ